MKASLPLIIFILALHAFPSKAQRRSVSLQSLLAEMTHNGRLARFPDPAYQSLQSSSYNRASVSPFKAGWFADGDGSGYIREDTTEGRKEYVIMEHKGPGCITRMWTPFFYYSLDNHTGPNIRVYIDGKSVPALKENFIQLLTGKSFVHPPFANLTTRAGVCYFPIPFAKSCKVTLDEKPFYYCISYRAYPRGQPVESFSMNEYKKAADIINETAHALTHPSAIPSDRVQRVSANLKANDSVSIALPAESNAIQYMQFRIETPVAFGALRNVLLKMSFDGQETVWCPLGDFFCSGDRINNFHTKYMEVKDGNTMICRWVMPYRSDAEIKLVNFSSKPVRMELEVHTAPWNWDKRSMYFHGDWCDYGCLPGNKFFDLNFIHVKGKGVIAGDALMVLSPSHGWWGEGDEKIYISKADINRHFPSLFGTGTEDYYGWAGGIVPSGKDTFSIPFGSNVRNGNQDNPRGYNICIRNRILDDIPFEDALRFDMEASPGVDIRHYDNLLSYSMVTYWYGFTGVKTNREPSRQKIKSKLMPLSTIDLLEKGLKTGYISPASMRAAEKVKSLGSPPE